MTAQIIGGIGLFLLGMILMTEGLKSLAGDALCSILERFVRGPLSGMAWGAGITALVQSSSATTLMTIGFVSAGLLTFAQSIGVIIGANLGTTSTSWIVSAVGLKFSMSVAALPMIGFGAVARLVGNSWQSAAGTALAGFGLIFVGIDTLQLGMQGLAARIDPAAFPGMTLTDLPLLVVIGVVMTVMMQSSSAAVATTLAALHTGAIGLEQAAALVIGQNIGTTVKAALASVGASTAARRTALAHILFNVITGLLALAMLPMFFWVAFGVAVRAEGDAGAVSLAAFHTAFNLLGVLVFLPFLTRFARLIERIIPEHKPVLARHLDESVANLPSVAVETVRHTASEIAAAVLDALQRRMSGMMARAEMNKQLAAADTALLETQGFLGRVSMEAASQGVFERHLASVHAVDHLRRLVEACRERPSMSVFEQGAALNEARQEVLEHMSKSIDWLSGRTEDQPVARLERLSKSLAETRRLQRRRLLEEIAAGTMSPQSSVRELEAFLWIDRVCYHLWRVALHLEPNVSSNAELAVVSETFTESPATS